MMQIGRTGVLLAVILTFVRGASAQDGQPATAPNMPRWDVDASIGLLNTRDVRDEANGSHQLPQWYDTDAMAAYVFGVGRFWTQHLKSDVGVTLTPEQHAFGYVDTFPSPGLPPGAFAYVDRASRLTTLSGTLAYQFFENAFVHPYVSAGVHLAWVREHLSRGETTTTLNRVTYTIPALDERNTSLLARPIAAVGCKSYFNERTFVRTEALVAFNSRGASQTTFRIGAGVDF